MFVTPVEAESFDILVEKTRPIVGLKVNPISGPSFILPISPRTAAEIGTLLVRESNERGFDGH
jgi:hypothetical protein